MIHEDLGLPMATAETIFVRMCRDSNALRRWSGVRRFITISATTPGGAPRGWTLTRPVTDHT